MSILFDNQADEELKNFSDYMVSHVYNQNNNQQSTHNQSLSRFRSAPSSFLTSLVDVNGGFNDQNSNVGNENYRNNRSTSPEIETVFPKLISSTNESDNAKSRFKDMPMKQEAQKQSLYHNDSSRIFHNQEARVSWDNSSFSVPNSLGLEQQPIQSKTATGSFSNLARQSSSPTGFFSEMNIENEEVNENIDRLSSQGNRISQNAKLYRTNFPNSSQDYSLLSSKRRNDENSNVFLTSNIFDIQNEDSGNRGQHLTHHLSLPVNFNDLSSREKIIQFQDSVPFKVRARRGCATHPRSIAERVRKTRISERMKKLQDLFPAMDKQTSTAEMLDLAVEYIKDLQKQAKTLSETRANCRCLGR